MTKNFSWGDPKTAMALRDLIQKLALKVIKEERPSFRFAEIVTMDAAGWTAVVHYKGEPVDATAIVKMGALQPANIGCVVLIGGDKNKRFIVQVFGPAVVAS